MKIEILTDEMIENAVTIEGDAVVFTCDRDHCTPEERAVIDVVLRYRNHMREKYHYIAVEYLFSSMDSEDGRLCAAVIEAADALAARAGKETG